MQENADNPAAGRKQALFLEQKATLDTFLSTGAITKEQYLKSLNTLREKLGIPEENGEH